MLNTMNFKTMTFQGTPLGKALFTKIAFIWSNTSVRSSMPLQIKCIIEAFTAECA